ncbi:MAG: hypothetical protein V1645_00645 [archaeon]
MKKETIPDRYFYLAITILGIYFLIRLIDQARMIWTFPLGVTYDYPSHLGQLFFFAKYGFHSTVPNWYNGFKLFLFYPPGWYLLALPIYITTKNILLTTYSTIIIMFAAIFTGIWLLGKKEGWSKTKRTAFFLLLFGNTLAVGNYIRLGRVSELFALTNLVLLAALIYIYKDKKLDIWFAILFGISYPLLILGHPATAIIFHVLLLSFLITRKTASDIITLTLLTITGLLVSSFWWYPFLTTKSNELARSTFSVTQRLLDFNYWAWDSWGTFIIVGAFLATFYLYWATNKKTRRDLIFYMPPIIVSILLITRTVIFIPILKEVYPDVYMMFFLLLTLYMLMNINFKKTPSIFKVIILAMLMITPIASVFASHIHTPYFIGHMDKEDRTIEIMRYVDGKVVIRDKPIDFVGVYPFPLYTYGAIHYDIKTPEGNNNFRTTTTENEKRFGELTETVEEGDCTKLKTVMNQLTAEEIISYDHYCPMLERCGLIKIKQIENVCLYKIIS